MYYVYYGSASDTGHDPIVLGAVYFYGSSVYYGSAEAPPSRTRPPLRTHTAPGPRPSPSAYATKTTGAGRRGKHQGTFPIKGPDSSFGPFSAFTRSGFLSHPIMTLGNLPKQESSSSPSPLCIYTHADTDSHKLERILGPLRWFVTCLGRGRYKKPPKLQSDVKKRGGVRNMPRNGSAWHLAPGPTCALECRFGRQISRVGSLRSFATSTRHQMKNKVPEHQKLFQADNGLPVHLKGGTVDALLYRFTMSITIFGSCYSVFSLVRAAFPQKK